MNILSITSAPVMITGRSSCWSIVGVVLELECPVSRAISATVTPDSDMTETNVDRNSRGAQTRFTVAWRAVYQRK